MLTQNNKECQTAFRRAHGLPAVANMLITNDTTVLLEGCKAVSSVCENNSKNADYICRSTDLIYTIVAKIKDTDTSERKLIESFCLAIRTVLHGTWLLDRINYLEINHLGFLNAGIIEALEPFIKAGIAEADSLRIFIESASPQEVAKIRAEMGNKKEPFKKKESRRRFEEFYADGDASDTEENMKYLTKKSEADYISDGEDEDNSSSLWPGPERNNAYLKLKTAREEERKIENVKPTFPVNYRPRPSYVIAPIMGAPDPRFYSSHYYGNNANSSSFSKFLNVVTTNPFTTAAK